MAISTQKEVMANTVIIEELLNDYIVPEGSLLGSIELQSIISDHSDNIRASLEDMENTFGFEMDRFEADDRATIDGFCCVDIDPIEYCNSLQEQVEEARKAAEQLDDEVDIDAVMYELQEALEEFLSVNS